MSKIYKIHPGIGIGRIGNSPDKFFIGPESPDKPPQEINGGTETALKTYKDANGRIKRQAVRFRIYEYEKDAAGNLSGAREITTQDAKIEWQVELANTKAAAPKLQSRPDINGLPVPPNAPLRNPGVPVDKLMIRPVFDTISGKDQHLTAATKGLFMDTEVFLGELRTDADGRLIVLGGRGDSASVPAGLAITNFANNVGWHDDTSDGTVTAKITFPGQPPKEVDSPSWVIFGPPDFAPDVKGVITLYDRAFQGAVSRGFLAAPAIPSFNRDILPILRRASDLRWVNRFGLWSTIPRDWAKLGDHSTPATADQNAELRGEIFDFLASIETENVLDSFRFTSVQTKFLEHWRDGNFSEDFDPNPAPVTDITPENLDRAALENTVGGGFFPGIEAGVKMTYAEIYEEPFRLTGKQYTHLGFTEKLRPGSMTERMACPWQADFRDCQGNWWPAQRPDQVFTNAAQAAPNTAWDRGINTFKNMVDNFSRLGFVVPRTQPEGDTKFLETERDPAFPG